MSSIRGLGTITVIRGKGDVQVIINDVVSKEVQRLRAQDRMELEILRKQLKDEMEWKDMARKNRDRLLKEKCKVLNAKQCKTFKERAIDKIEFPLACLIVWGEALKLIEHVGNKEEWK